MASLMRAPTRQEPGAVNSVAQVRNELRASHFTALNPLKGVAMYPLAGIQITSTACGFSSCEKAIAVAKEKEQKNGSSGTSVNTTVRRQKHACAA